MEETAPGNTSTIKQALSRYSSLTPEQQKLEDDAFYLVEPRINEIQRAYRSEDGKEVRPSTESMVQSLKSSSKDISEAFKNHPIMTKLHFKADAEEWRDLATHMTKVLSSIPDIYDPKSSNYEFILWQYSAATMFGDLRDHFDTSKQSDLTDPPTMENFRYRETKTRALKSFTDDLDKILKFTDSKEYEPVKNALGKSEEEMTEDEKRVLNHWFEVGEHYNELLSELTDNNQEQPSELWQSNRPRLKILELRQKTPRLGPLINPSQTRSGGLIWCQSRSVRKNDRESLFVILEDLKAGAERACAYDWKSGNQMYITCSCS